MTNNRITTSRQPAPAVSLVGGKAHALHAMQGADLPVPEWICLTTLVHDEWAAARRGGATAAMADLLPEVACTLLKTCGEMFPGVASFAVRSSATVEDGADTSYAGQFESFLNVRPGRLLNVVEQVILSADSPRVRAYRAARGGGPEPRMAVLVQPMIDAVASGVLFTADPVTGDASRSMITAALGLGEGVVQDQADADTWVVDHAHSHILERRIARKQRMVVSGEESGTQLVEIDAVAADAPALSDGDLCRLVDLGRRVQSLFGRPQDVEWALDRGGRLVLLQSRPITTASGGRIYDNANIIENYPGLTLPLTFSFARATYEHTFRAASRAFGVPERMIAASPTVYANLVALVKGRMYYDVLNWYELYLMVPGFESLVPAWEKALGLPQRSVAARGRSAPLIRLRIVARMAWLFLRRGGMMRSFRRRFEAVQRDVHARDLDAMSADQLFALYETVFEQLTGRFRITLINDLFAQQSFGLLDKLLHKWCPDSADRLRTELLAGVSGMASMELLVSMESLANEIRSRPAWRALFSGGNEPGDVWRIIHEGPSFAELARGIQAHVQRFGNRTVLELKLETPGVNDDPSVFLENLRTLINGAGDRPHSKPIDRRRAAESQLRHQDGVGPLCAAVLRRLLAYCRATMRDRETLRLLRARAYDTVRKIFAQIGGHMAIVGALADSRDVFYLTVEEIDAAVRSTVASDFRECVSTRKGDYEHFAGMELPPRIEPGRTPPPPISIHPMSATVLEVPEGTTLLRGMGCSAGTAHGPARVVLDPQQAGDVSGAIIVAHTTDPGWVFLMTRASGLVVERGNMLSHTAIVGRELGLPIVAGVLDATRRIPDGCMLQIDGGSGTVLVSGDPSASDRA